MSSYFCISIGFLQPMCHGRGDGGEPEWPPSPLRVFQALVAAAAARWNERTRLACAAPALHWLERQPAPSIIAGIGERSSVQYRLYVPDNVGDKVAASLSRGGKASIADYRTEKDICPTHLLQEDPAVHYVWPLADDDPEFEKHKEVLSGAVRSITHLGWGRDMVAASASIISEAEVDELPGQHWRPSNDGFTMSCRVPIKGTLDGLIERHEAFLKRIGPDGFHPVPPLTAFRVVGYRRPTDPPELPLAAFSLLKPDASGFRSFNTASRGIVCAGMMRCAARKAGEALGWSEERLAGFVLGHGEVRGQPHLPASGPRLAYIPLPSIESRGEGRAQVVGPVRRVLVTVIGGRAADEHQQVARLLSGSELIDEENKSPLAILSRLPSGDKMVRRYTKPASTWATVTPVILPGYDDPRKLRQRLFSRSGAGRSPLTAQEQKDLLAKLDKRIDHLLRKAIRQAGYSDELARAADIEWRKVGFWPGTELATRYRFPNKLRRFRRLHVRITWRDTAGNPISMPGPLCLGAGRFYGLGLFAGGGGVFPG